MRIDFFRWITLIILVIPAQALGGAIEELQNFVNQSVSGQSTFVQRVYDSTGALVQADILDCDINLRANGRLNCTWILYGY